MIAGPIGGEYAKSSRLEPGRVEGEVDRSREERREARLNPICTDFKQRCVSYGLATVL